MNNIIIDEADNKSAEMTAENFNETQTDAQTSMGILEKTEFLEEINSVSGTTQSEENDDDEEDKEDGEEKSENSSFKLTLPANIEELTQKMCAKRGRKLLYKPNETLFEATFQILGLNDKNEEGINSNEIFQAEIAEGLKLGYLAKFDGLKTSEIKEEYEDDCIFELAGQELRKMGIIYENGEIKVYVFDWDKKGCHHIGKIDTTVAQEAIKFFEDKDKYSFNLCGIITGGSLKKVIKDEKGKIKISKDKGEPLSVELDVAIVPRKD